MPSPNFVATNPFVATDSSNSCSYRIDCVTVEQTAGENMRMCIELEILPCFVDEVMQYFNNPPFLTSDANNARLLEAENVEG